MLFRSVSQSRYGSRLADEVRKYGKQIEDDAKKELDKLYPKDSEGYSPVAYFWARLIKCEGPKCGVDVPVMRSLWLAKKPKRKIALKINPNKTKKQIEFEIIYDANESHVGKGTSKRSSVTCPLCGYTTPRPNVEAQANKNRPKERLIAVASVKSGVKGKKYRLPETKDFEAILEANRILAEHQKRHDHKDSLIPNEELPYLRSIFNVHVYGYRDWGSLFTERQKVSIVTMLNSVERANRRLSESCDDPELVRAVKTLLAFCSDRIIANCNSLCWWVVSWEVASSAFARQALGMVWDFAEIYPFADEEGWSKVCEWVSNTLEEFGRIPFQGGTVAQCSADKIPLPADSASLAFTDPPYYDAVPYADLSNPLLS